VGGCKLDASRSGQGLTGASCERKFRFLDRPIGIEEVDTPRICIHSIRKCDEVSLTR
jgi:hypothetical protein